MSIIYISRYSSYVKPVVISFFYKPMPHTINHLEQGHGSPLVFLHGIGGSAASWRWQLDEFSRTHRAMAWDMPGYGASDPLPAPTTADFAQALDLFLREQQVERPILVGHSIGGMIVQEYLATFPEKASAVVLYATSPAFGRKDGAWQQEFLRARLGPLNEGKTMAELAPGIVQSLIGTGAKAEGIALVTQCMAAVGRYVNICRFSSPFIQDTLYHTFSSDLIGNDMPILALHPLDDLADVFAFPNNLELPALLRRYKEYLARLNAKGINPWKEQPRRQTDLHLLEAVGHFHLYAWLQNAIGRRCAVTPEFPNGNGRVDLHIRCGERRGIIEVKSFTDQYQAGEDRKQAARYAKKLGFDRVTMAVFVPIEDETVLEKLSVSDTVDGVTVQVTAIRWV